MSEQFRGAVDLPVHEGQEEVPVLHPAETDVTGDLPVLPPVQVLATSDEAIYMSCSCGWDAMIKAGETPTLVQLVELARTHSCT